MSKRGLHLYKRLALTAFIALIGLGGAAQADIHAAGPVYGGTTPTQVNGMISCRVFNFGSVPVSITTRQIIDSNGTNVIPANDTCGAPLVVGGSCVYVATITALVAYSCRVIDATTGSTSLSGVAEIQSSAGQILNVLPLVH
jgi:hypothetical protein